MSWFIDTNIISCLMRGDQRVRGRWLATPAPDILIPAIVLAEGLAGSPRIGSPRYRAAWQTIAEDYAIVPFDQVAADAYGRLRADLEARGQMIGHRDCQIAATAQAWQTIHPDDEVTLVTNNNGRAFARVPDLRWEDWSG